MSTLLPRYFFITFIIKLGKKLFFMPHLNKKKMEKDSIINYQSMVCLSSNKKACYVNISNIYVTKLCQGFRRIIITLILIPSFCLIILIFSTDVKMFS